MMVLVENQHVRPLFKVNKRDKEYTLEYMPSKYTQNNHQIEIKKSV